MSVQDKTAALERRDLPLAWLEPNPDNPNEMTGEQFNMLSDNFEQLGWTEPVLVRQLGPERYRIMGGHHRVEVAKVQGLITGPCTIINDPNFTDDMEKAQVVRMNVIHGKMNTKKFLKLYESLSTKYAEDVAREMFGFTDKDEWDVLVGQMAKELPKDAQADFKKAAADIKTVDGLSALLNKMFAMYGDTLPYNYMVMDYGGRESVWIRLRPGDKKDLMKLGKKCIEAGVTLDSVLTHMMRDPALVVQSIAAGTKAIIPETMKLPTEENLQ